MGEYLVVIDSDFVYVEVAQNSQIEDKLDNDVSLDMDCWSTMEDKNVMVGIYEATSRYAAINMASEEIGRDSRVLRAYKLDRR